MTVRITLTLASTLTFCNVYLTNVDYLPHDHVPSRLAEIARACRPMCSAPLTTRLKIAIAVLSMLGTAGTLLAASAQNFLQGVATDSTRAPAGTSQTALNRANAAVLAELPGRELADDAVEARLLADAADGCLDRCGLFEAALIAGGVRDQAQLEGYQARFVAWRETLAESTAGLKPRDAARAVLAFMHREILVGGYDVECTDLARTLDRGTFNCVSSAVLFNCLADALCLRTAAVESPGHACSLLLADGESVEVQTTCPDWFDCLNDPERCREIIARVTAHGESAEPPRRMDNAGLIAVIYYNRGVDLLAARRLEEGALANLKALRLDGGNLAARRNLLAALNNWAVQASSDERYAQSMRLLDAGLAFDSSYANFRTNYAVIANRWGESLARQHRYQEVQALRERTARQVPEAASFNASRAEIQPRGAGPFAALPGT